MIGHAAAAAWLRTQPWWDWRGWSDWFYGGQAIGVNYPPLTHAWLRFTHPVHGQMAAVALGLLVLLPWGALRLARAVGFSPSTQRAALGIVLVLIAAAGNMHWILPSFHYTSGFFGSWPAMLAVVLGLFCAAWAARCRQPVACGIVAGVAILFNATVVPGTAVVCAALLVTSGVSFRRAVRWCTTAGAAALAVSAWWLVPFLAGWDRLVRWEIPLSEAWKLGGVWQVAVLAALGVAATWAARSSSNPSRRLALAAAAGLLATLLGDLFGYLRPERWLALPILVAAVAVAGLFGVRTRRDWHRPIRPAWAVLGVACLLVFVVVTLRGGGCTPCRVAAVVATACMGSRRRVGVGRHPALCSALELDPPPCAGPRYQWCRCRAAAAYGGPGAEGLVYIDNLHATASDDTSACAGGYSWRTTIATGGRVRPLLGFYRETSQTAEFLAAALSVRAGAIDGPRPIGSRPHWFDAWQDAGGPSLGSLATAEAVGARWYASCDANGNVSVTELAGTTATGVLVAAHIDEDEWHRAAVEWWVPIAAGVPVVASDGVDHVPVLSSGERAVHPLDRAAEGVSLHAARDSLTVRAETAGWAWLRVPWDPDWRSVDGTPVRKGGPGHLVVWANQGATRLRWSVPGAVDVAAAATTGAAVLAVAVLAVVNHRRGFEADPDRRRPAAEAVGVFADTVDGWAQAASRRASSLAAGVRRCVRS